MATRTKTTSVDRAANWILSQSWSTLALIAALSVGASVAAGSFAPANLVSTSIVSNQETSRTDYSLEAVPIIPVAGRVGFSAGMLKAEVAGCDDPFTDDVESCSGEGDTGEGDNPWGDEGDGSGSGAGGGTDGEGSGGGSGGPTCPAAGCGDGEYCNASTEFVCRPMASCGTACDTTKCEIVDSKFPFGTCGAAGEAVTKAMADATQACDACNLSNGGSGPTYTPEQLCAISCAAAGSPGGAYTYSNSTCTCAEPPPPPTCSRCDSGQCVAAKPLPGSNSCPPATYRNADCGGESCVEGGEGGNTPESPKPSPDEKGIDCYTCTVDFACEKTVVLSNQCPKGSSPTGCDDSCVKPLPGIFDEDDQSNLHATAGEEGDEDDEEEAGGNPFDEEEEDSADDEGRGEGEVDPFAPVASPAHNYGACYAQDNERGSCAEGEVCQGYGNDGTTAGTCMPEECDPDAVVQNEGFNVFRSLAKLIFADQVHAQGGVARSQPCMRALLDRIATGDLVCSPDGAAKCAGEGGKGCFKNPANSNQEQCFVYTDTQNICTPTKDAECKAAGKVCSACFGGCVTLGDFCHKETCEASGGECSDITLSCVPKGKATCEQVCGQAGLSCVDGQCKQDRCRGTRCPSGNADDCDKNTGLCKNTNPGDEIIVDACTRYEIHCPDTHKCSNIPTGSSGDTYPECVPKTQSGAKPTACTSTTCPNGTVCTDTNTSSTTDPVVCLPDPCDPDVAGNRVCPPSSICQKVNGYAECKVPANQVCDSFGATTTFNNDCVGGAECKLVQGVGQCVATNQDYCNVDASTPANERKACPVGMVCESNKCKVNRTECSTNVDCTAGGFGLKTCQNNRCALPANLDPCYLTEMLNDSTKYGMSASEVIEAGIFLQGKTCAKAAPNNNANTPIGVVGLPFGTNVNGKYVAPNLTGTGSQALIQGAINMNSYVFFQSGGGGTGNNNNRNVNGTVTTGVKIVPDPGKGTCAAVAPGSGWVMHTQDGKPGTCPDDCSIIRVISEAEKDIGPTHANHPVNVCYNPNPTNKAGSDKDDAYCRKADGTPDESKCEKVCVGAYNGGDPAENVDRQGCFYVPKSAAGLNSCPIQTTGFKRGNSTWGGINVDPVALEAYERGRADFCASNDFCTVPLVDGSNPPSSAVGVDDSGKFAVCKCVNGFPSCEPRIESGCRENVGKGLMVYNPNGANSSWNTSPPPGCTFQTSPGDPFTRTPTPSPATGGADSSKLPLCPDATSSTLTAQCKYPIHPWFNLTSSTYPSSTSDRLYAVFGGPNTFVPASCWRVQEYVPSSSSDNNPWAANLIEVEATASTDNPGFFRRVWNWVKGLFGSDDNKKVATVSFSADMLTAGLMEDCMEHTKIGIGQERRTGTSAGTGVSNRGECRALFPTYYNPDGSLKTREEVCTTTHGNKDCIDGNGVVREAITMASYVPPVIQSRRYYAVPTCSGSGPSPINPNQPSPSPAASASPRPSSSPIATTSPSPAVTPSSGPTASPTACGNSCSAGQCKSIAGYGPFCVSQNTCATAPSPCGVGKYMCVTDDGQWSCTSYDIRNLTNATCVVCQNPTPSPSPTASGSPRPSSSPIASASPTATPSGAVTSFAITAPDVTTVGTPITVSVCAKNAQGATATGYRGIVYFFIPEDSNAVVPFVDDGYDFTAVDNGCHTFERGIIFARSGAPTITVVDADHPYEVYGQRKIVVGTSTSSPSPSSSPGTSPSPSASPLVCPQDLKLCPDGSYVGRTQPSCQFATCPNPTNNSNTNSVACSAEARLCADGSVVSRVKPSCDFAPCQKVLGDVTGDGRITIADVVQITDFLAGKPGVTLSSEQFLLADVTCDRLLNLADVAKIANFIVTGADGASRTLTCGNNR